MRVILVYKMYLYLLVNTFYLVSKTKIKSSENLKFHPILGTNYTQYGENAATKGILCDSISVSIHFSAILYIIYSGIDDWVIVSHKSEHFTYIFSYFIFQLYAWNQVSIKVPDLPTLPIFKDSSNPHPPLKIFWDHSIVHSLKS